MSTQTRLYVPRSTCVLVVEDSSNVRSWRSPHWKLSRIHRLSIRSRCSSTRRLRSSWRPQYSCNPPIPISSLLLNSNILLFPLLYIRFKKSRTRQRLKTASTKLQKTHQTFREYKYSRSISLNLPISASLNPELGSGWFDSTGAPLVTKSKNGRYVIPWETEATKKSFYSFLGWQWERFWGTSEGKLIPGEGELKVVKPVLPEEIEGGYLTWLGHASAVFSVFGEVRRSSERSDKLVY